MSGLPEDTFPKLLQSGKYSDFVVSTNGIEFKVHKVIIASGSDFFRAVCDGGFKEEIDCCVDLPDDPPDIVARVLWYLYTGKYDPAISDHVPVLLWGSKGTLTYSILKDEDEADTPRRPSRPVLIEHLKIDVLTYQCADKLNVLDLKKAAAKSFHRNLLSYIWCKCNSDDLHPIFGALPRMAGLSEVADLVYETTSCDNLEIRTRFTEKCIDEHESTESDEALLSIIRKHEFVAWTTGRMFKVRYEELSFKANKAEKVHIVKMQELQDAQARAENEHTINMQGFYDAQERAARAEGASLQANAQLATLQDRMSKMVKDSSGKAITSTAGAEVKYCPHCGSKGFVSVTAGKQTQVGEYLERFTTECVECGKKWTFMTK